MSEPLAISLFSGPTIGVEGVTVFWSTAETGQVLFI